MAGGGYYAHENATIQDLREIHDLVGRDLRLDNDNADDGDDGEEDDSCRKEKDTEGYDAICSLAYAVKIVVRCLNY